MHPQTTVITAIAYLMKKIKGRQEHIFHISYATRRQNIFQQVKVGRAHLTWKREMLQRHIEYAGEAAEYTIVSLWFLGIPKAERLRLSFLLYI